MASTGKCRFCGATVTSDEKQCSGCGAANPNYVAKENLIITHPRSIEELKTYCAQHGMPLLRMRFFIDENYTEPKAFGIYRDGDQFVVYKNKSDGSRSVRYHGPDESYAVNELFLKLLDECHKRNIYPDGEPSGGQITRGSKDSGNKWAKRIGRAYLIFIIAFIIGFAILVFNGIGKHRQDGYYRTSTDRIYYKYGDDWYTQSGSDWSWTAGFPEDNYTEHYEGENFDSDWGGESFKDSDQWKELKTRSNDSNSSSDYDSWDSDDTDWDSDW